MASMEEGGEEATQSGFTLNLFKCNNVRSTNRRNDAAKTKNRGGIKKTRNIASHSRRRGRGSTRTITSHKDGKDSKTKKKSTSRKHILSCISGNSTKRKIPIPSFTFRVKNDRDSEYEAKLDRLEREFFDEESDGGSDASSIGDVKRIFANSKSKVNTNTVDGDKSHVSPSSSKKDVHSSNNNNTFSATAEVDSDETETDNSDDEIPSVSKLQEKERQQQINVHQTEESEIQNKAIEIIDKTKPTGKRIDLPSSLGKTNSPVDTPTKASDTMKINIYNENDDDNDNDDDNSIGKEEDGIGSTFVNLEDCSGDVNGDFGNDERNTKLFSTNKDSIDEDLVALPFDLDREIDTLFLNSDANVITFNQFFEELEKTGISLDKITKKKVKTRLLSLINDRAKPNNPIFPEMKKSKNNEDNGAILTTKTREMDDLDICVEEKGFDAFVNEGDKNCEQPKTSVSKSNLNGVEKITQSNTAKNNKRRKFTKKRANQDVHMKGNTKVPSMEVVDAGLRIKETETSRECKSKSKKSSTNKKSSTSVLAASRPRKRARSKLCAFCKTCSCQKTDGNDTIPILDMDKFSRTNAAKEKALIRRLQNLERKTESLEEQTEVARRQLKKHRRDTWKREKRELGNTDGPTTDKVVSVEDYFLPDAEIFETQQLESRPLSGGLFEKAQFKVFPKAPTYQPTLTQMMGFSNSNDKSTKGEASIEITDHNKNTDEAESETKDTITAKYSLYEEEYDSEDDGSPPIEYVPEREFTDKIKRFERSSCIRVIEDGTIGVDLSTRSKCRWDDMFKTEDMYVDAVPGDHSVSEDPIDHEAGLNDLLCLFEDETETQEKDSSSGYGDEQLVHISCLSQAAQSIADQIITNFCAADKTQTALQRSCPNWKENIYFALLQKDPDEIQEALENVKQCKVRMRATKQKMLDAWENKNIALEVFESALVKSAARLKPHLSTPEYEDDGGFLTQAD